MAGLHACTRPYTTSVGPAGLQPAGGEIVDPVMGLLRYVVQGIGWRVGREIAEEGIDEVRARTDAEAPLPSEAELRRQRRRDERAQKKAEQARERQARRREQEIERELADLKRKIGRDG
jgi:hypothetical protein